MNVDKRSRLISLAAMVVLIAALVIMSFGLLKGYLTSSQSNMVIIAGLLIFWLMTDVLEPFACKRFDNITIGMRGAYLKYILLDLAGYAGIVYFLTGVGGTGQSSGILGAVIYVVTMKPKRKQQRIFMGIEPEDEGQETIEGETETTEEGTVEETEE